MLPLLVDDPPSVGPYRLVARLGAGGMGQVFLATDDQRQLVALKLVHPGLAHDDEFRRRFRREVVAGRRLGGPFVAPVLAADPDAATPWLASEYVPGPSLDDAVATAGPLGIGPARVLGHGLATALAGIHAAGLVHRDVKPSNVLLGPDRPRLIDFGISRAADSTALTSTGAVLGTPAYMSPEQAEGLAVDAASDVFSFGAVLVYATSGRPPFGDGAPAALLLRICDHDPDLEAVPVPLRGPVAACLAKAPGDRPTAAAVRELFADPDAEAGPGWLPAPVAELAAATVPVGSPTAGPPAGSPPAVPDRWSPTRGAAPTAPVRRRVSRRTVLAGAGAAGLTAAVAFGASALVGTPAVTVPQAPGATGPRVLWSSQLGANQSQYPAVEVVPSGPLLHVLTGNVQHALDAGTGAVRWSHPCAFDWSGDGYRTPSVAVSDGAVVVGTNATVTALDAETGAVRWESRLAGDPNPFFVARVAVGAGLVYYAYRDTLVGLDGASGASRWTHPLGAEVSALAVADGRVFVTGTTLHVAVDAATGAQVWQRPTDNEGLGNARLAVAAGSVYRWVQNGPLAAVTSVDAATGAPRWSSSLGTSAAWGHYGPAVVGGLVVVTLGERDQRLRALDAATGTVRWEGVSGDGRAVEIGPVADGDAICCAGRHGQVYVFDAATGGRRWEYDGSGYLSDGDALALGAGIAYVGKGGGTAQVDAVAMA